MKKFVLGWALALSVVSVSAFAQGGGLFIHNAKSALGAPYLGDDPAVVRRAPVLFNSAVIPTLDTPPGTIINANVFGDVSLSIVLETLRITSEFTYSWSGYILEEPDTSYAVFTIHDGVMVANIHSPTSGTYQLRTTSDGAPDIREIDLDLGGTCGVEGHVENPITPAAIQNLGIPKGGASVFDLLAVYTPAARTGAGGHAAIQAIIQLAVDEFNTALDNSLVSADVRLVHMEEISYTETGSLTFSNALSDVRGTSDGEMDSVHTLRDTYGADFVTLFLDDVEGTSTLGLAFVLQVGDLAGTGSSAFSTVQYDGSSIYVLAHEVGHNLGNVHESGGGGIYAYSQAYNEGSFCTIMCASASSSTVAHFSNPTTGHGITDVRDVARSIDEVAGSMSAFRSPADKLSVVPFADFDSTKIATSTASPDSKTYTLTNLGASSSITWTASASETWVTLNSSGSTISAGSTFDLIATIDSSAFSLPIGGHTATITITDTTNSDVYQFDVNFTVPVVGFSFDSDPSWTTGTGWAFGMPTGGGGFNGNPDPTGGFTGSNVYGVNLSGDVPGGVFDTSPSFLKTTAIDLSNASNTMLSFRRHLNGFGATQSATATVDVSNDDSNWTNLFSIDASGLFEATWSLVTYDISAVADGQSTVFVRWGYSTTDAGLHPSFFPASGWNIDDVVISGDLLLAEVWVDFAYGGTQSGSESEPYDTLAAAINAVSVGGTIKLKGDTATNESTEAITIDKQMTIEAINGPVRIGVASP